MAKKSGCKKKMYLTAFLKAPAVDHVFSVSGDVTGITVLGSDVFVVRHPSHVDVYDSTSFTSTRSLIITGSEQLEGIVSCSHNNCLYVIDSAQDIIYRYDLSNNVTTKWSMSGQCYGLSVTKTDNVLITLRLRNPKRIQEYTTHGSLIRDISLDNSIVGPWHCV